MGKMGKHFKLRILGSEKVISRKVRHTHTHMNECALSLSSPAPFSLFLAFSRFFAFFLSHALGPGPTWRVVQIYCLCPKQVFCSNIDFAFKWCTELPGDLMEAGRWKEVPKGFMLLHWKVKCSVRLRNPLTMEVPALTDHKLAHHFKTVNNNSAV